MYAAYGAILNLYQVTVCIIYTTNWQLNNAPPPQEKKPNIKQNNNNNNPKKNQKKKTHKTEKDLENLTRF